MKDTPSPGLPTSLVGRGLRLLRLGRPLLQLKGDPDEVVARNARRYLAESLGRLRGLPQKVGQILSMVEAGDPAQEAFAGLREAGEPLPFEVAAAVLEREWGRPWRDVLAGIDPQGRAASLGQVHRSRLRGGEDVAIKVQYPGIAEAVQADLGLLGWLSLPLGGFGKSFDLAGYRRELLRDLQEELDYRREAESQRAYGRLAAGLPGLVIPEPIAGLSTERVLVTRWEEGETLEEVARTWAPDARAEAARLFLAHALGLFRHGFVHADLHPGNYRFRRGAGGRVELVLYDFGCLFRAPLQGRLAFLRLIDITEANGADDPFPLFLALGFRREYLDPLADRLPALCRVLFEPFILPSPYAVRRWALGERVGAILGEHRWNFRIAGPPELIFLMRMFHGLIHALRTLDAPVSWKAALEPIRAEFAEAATALPLAEEPRSERSFGRVAKHLAIRVMRAGALRVRITSPLHAIDCLDELLDEEVLAQIRGQGIDLAALVRRVRESGYAPQEVFALRTGDKDVRVWLE